MHELRLTDLELQSLLAPALKARLRQEGFKFGESESPHDETHNLLLLPVNLDLADEVMVERTDDGVWVFRQSNPAISRRLLESMLAHGEAIEARTKTLDR